MTLIQRRHKEITIRKTALPIVLMICTLWVGIFIIIGFVDPQTLLILPVLFSLIFVALFLTISFLSSNTRRGLLYSLAIIVFLTFRYVGIHSLVVVVVLCGITLLVDLYLSKR